MERLEKQATFTFLRDDDEKPLKIIVTDKLLGRGDFTDVRFGNSKDLKGQTCYALKIIDEC